MTKHSNTQHVLYYDKGKIVGYNKITRYEPKVGYDCYGECNKCYPFANFWSASIVCRTYCNKPEYQNGSVGFGPCENLQ